MKERFSVVTTFLFVICTTSFTNVLSLGVPRSVIIHLTHNAPKNNQLSVCCPYEQKCELQMASTNTLDVEYFDNYENSTEMERTPKQGINKDETFSELNAPTMQDIVKFAIPATGIWLCGPLLSLIDTSIVGFFAGTVQQAALNPAVALTDYGGLLVVSFENGSIRRTL